MSTAPDTSKPKADPKVDAKAKKATDATPAKAAKSVKSTKAATSDVVVAAKPEAKKGGRKMAVKKPTVKRAKPLAADGAPKLSTHMESRLAQILIAPIVSEKATMAAEKHNQVLFKVMRDATKPEIKAAVELMFKVTVDSVQTVQHKGKTKRFGKGTGRRDHVKKAYVCLAAGQELNFSGEGA
jgi:large subunit ribosomal protein L23